jgi:hypothetical protein
MVRLGRQVTKAGDKGHITTALLSSMGQPVPTCQVTPYGLFGSPPYGSSWVIFNVAGSDSGSVGFGNDYEKRRKDLKEGEVVLMNTKTGAGVYLNERGVFLGRVAKEEEEGGGLGYQTVDVGTGQSNTRIRIGEHVRDDDAYLGQVDVNALSITLESTREGNGVRVGCEDGSTVYVEKYYTYMDSEQVICGEDLHVYGNIYVYGSIVQM